MTGYTHKTETTSGGHRIFHYEDAGSPEAFLAHGAPMRPWFFEPIEGSGDIYSEGYSTYSEAFNACAEWEVRETLEAQREREQRE